MAATRQQWQQADQQGQQWPAAPAPCALVAASGLEQLPQVAMELRQAEVNKELEMVTAKAKELEAEREALERETAEAEAAKAAEAKAVAEAEAAQAASASTKARQDELQAAEMAGAAGARAEADEGYRMADAARNRVVQNLMAQQLGKNSGISRCRFCALSSRLRLSCARPLRS